MASTCKCMYTHTQTQTHRHTHHIKIHIQRTKTYAYGKNVKNISMPLLSRSYPRNNHYEVYISFQKKSMPFLFFESPDRAAGEVAQWIAELSVQAWGPVFGSQHPCVCACNSIAEGEEQRLKDCWGLLVASLDKNKTNKIWITTKQTNKLPWDRRDLSVRDPISKE